MSEERIPLCNAADLVGGGLAVPFDVVHGGETCRAFAIRFEGQPHAFLNRCSHVAMEMDFQPDRFFDDTGQWLLCATHGAAYRPDTGACARRPVPRRPRADRHDRAATAWCTGILAYNLQPLTF
jgi:nitrite reductase/ring-hydroxylating ferredoxin subunit